MLNIPCQTSSTHTSHLHIETEKSLLTIRSDFFPNDIKQQKANDNNAIQQEMLENKTPNQSFTHFLVSFSEQTFFILLKTKIYVFQWTIIDHNR